MDDIPTTTAISDGMWFSPDWFFLAAGIYLVIKLIYQQKEMRENFNLFFQNVLVAILFVVCVVGSKVVMHLSAFPQP